MFIGMRYKRTFKDNYNVVIVKLLLIKLRTNLTKPVLVEISWTIYGMTS